MELSLGFEDVAISQQKNIVKSRLDVDITSEAIKGFKLKIPLISANMSTVSDVKFCIKMNAAGALGVLHRMMPDSDIINGIAQIYDTVGFAAGSVGVGEGQLDLAKNMIKSGCNIVVIDIAHGYSDEVINLAKDIKNHSPETKVVIGNTTNIGLLEESYQFVDAVKVGIAQGLVCQTKNTAGSTEKQFSAVLKFKELSRKLGVPVISDGGIREPADLCKAIGAGAGSVMAGSVFAACPESAAELKLIDGKYMKLYAGSASEYVQNKWRGGLKFGTCAEGTIKYLEMGDNLSGVIEQYSGALRSGITYGGGKDIKSFQDNVKFVRFK